MSDTQPPQKRRLLRLALRELERFYLQLQAEGERRHEAGDHRRQHRRWRAGVNRRLEKLEMALAGLPALEQRLTDAERVLDQILED